MEEDAVIERQVEIQWERVLPLWDRQRLQCYKCNKIYVETENIGRWECVQEVNVLNDLTLQTFTFLIRADHSNEVDKKYDTVDDYYVQRNVFRSRAKTTFDNCIGIVPLTETTTERVNMFNLNSNVRIRRYDWRVERDIKVTAPLVPQNIFTSKPQRPTIYGMAPLYITKLVKR